MRVFVARARNGIEVATKRLRRDNLEVYKQNSYITHTYIYHIFPHITYINVYIVYEVYSHCQRVCFLFILLLSLLQTLSSEFVRQLRKAKTTSKPGLISGVTEHFKFSQFAKIKGGAYFQVLAELYHEIKNYYFYIKLYYYFIYAESN